MAEIDARLREDVHQLGELLGNTISVQHGAAFLDKIERIRKGAKASRRGSQEGAEQLSATLNQLDDDELLPVARAFNQFLNLANIAEQYHRVRRRAPGEAQPFEDNMLADLLQRLSSNGHKGEALARQFGRLDIELVLTAHPTEVARRTLIQKYDAMAEQLAAGDHSDLSAAEREQVKQRLQRLIAEAWHTEEIRRSRPSPVDEAKWGFAVIEHSLWHAIPNVLRKADQVLHSATGLHLPLDAAPIRFASWMGGDRDGNPNVTASITREVLLLARWMAADLYLRDVDNLAADLSMQQASDELRLAGGLRRGDACHGKAGARGVLRSRPVDRRTGYRGCATTRRGVGRVNLTLLRRTIAGAHSITRRSFRGLHRFGDAPTKRVGHAVGR